jgi:signal transduction histidine kinase
MMEHYPGSFTITMPEHTPDIKIGGEIRRHIYLAVKESLHNIIKHSGADKVNLIIKCEGKLIIKVADNGKGMNAEESNNAGNGLKNMKNRMEQLGGHFSVENKDGLTLIFEIPLNPVL